MERTARRERLLLAFSLLFLLYTILFLSGWSWLLRVTAPAPRPHALLRLSLPRLDIGADAWPAEPSAAGFVELWLYRHTADDVQTIVQIEGTPALQRSPPRRPRLPGTLAESLAARSALP